MKGWFERYKDLGAIEVEAAQITSDNVKDLTAFCGGLIVEELNPFDTHQTFVGINVPTPDGRRRASEGDYVVRNHNGEFRVFKHGAFLSMYEPV